MSFCKCIFGMCSSKDKAEKEEVINSLNSPKIDYNAFLSDNNNAKQTKINKADSSQRESLRRISISNNVENNQFSLGEIHESEKEKIEEENNKNLIQRSDNFSFVVQTANEGKTIKSKNSIQKEIKFDCIKSIKISKICGDQKIIVKENNNIFNTQVKC